MKFVTSFRKDAQAIDRRLTTFETLSKAIQCGVGLGPGRGDSFGIIRDLLFPSDGIKLDAPVSTPALFDFKNFIWVHWDGNSTSVLDRNIAQAIARSGADFDPVTGKSSVLPTAKRPRQFRVGTREFDPVKVGYVTDPEKGWLFNATIKGNENFGHEFGAELPEESRSDLVEYLKTL